MAAEKGGERIAVEVQSFPSLSAVADLQEAIGQYVLYRSVLSRQQPDRPLFLAVPPGRMVMIDLSARVLVFDPDRREVVRWIS